MKKNSINNDVFNAFLVKNATYDGSDEFPCIKTSELLPKKLVSFSKAIGSKDNDCWIHFYESDDCFERLWRNSKRYLTIIKKYKGVISPDYSLYYDMPLCMQKWNTYRGRALAAWLQENGVEVIPNIRWGDDRSFEFVTYGIEYDKTIAVGTHGCIKTLNDKKLFIEGFDYIVNKLKPKTIIVYGRMPNKIFCLTKLYGVELIQFESEFALTHYKEEM